VFGPQFIVGGHIRENSKGGVRDPLAFPGFQGFERQEESHRGSRSRETQSTLLGEGCDHISDNEGVSWHLVLGCTSVTHKDLWIHTRVCVGFPIGKPKS
jgi:hypothetical protein